MILKSQKLVEQFNVSCRFKLLNLILRKHVFSLQFKVLLQRKNSRILEPGILGKSKESRKRRNRERLPTKYLVP